MSSETKDTIAIEPAPAASSPAGQGVAPDVLPEAEVDPALDRFWVAVRRLPKYLKLGANLARDRQVPRSAKALLAVGGVYTVSPVDLIPGIIPVAGQIDDLVVLLLALRTATRACPPDVANAHLERAGLARSNFDEDLAATKDAALWLAGKGMRGSRRLAAKGMRGSERLAAKGSRQLGKFWRERIHPA